MWLSDARIVLSDQTLERGSVRIEEDRIVEVAEGPSRKRGDDSAIDARGLTIMPSIIDLHGDMLEREIEPRPGAQFPVEMALVELDKRLAATGVTTAYATVSFNLGLARDNLRSAERAQEIVRTIAKMRDSLLVEIGVHARFEITHPDVAPLLMDLLATGQIQLVSLNDHTPGQGQYRDIERYIEFMAKWRKISRADAEDRAAQRLQSSREAPASWAIARKITELARERGLPIASHDDDTPTKVGFVASLGVTISEFPVTMEAALEANRLGLHVAVGAPNALQGYSHIGNLSAVEAIEAGLVDILVADYHPAALLHAAFSLARQGLLPLHEAVKLITRNPATALGLTRSGAIAVGHYADVMLVDEGTGLRVRSTLRRGVPIYWDGSMARRVAGGKTLQPV